MRRILVAAVTILAAIGLQLAMVAGFLRPSFLLAFLGYGALFAGLALIVPVAVARARRRG